MLYRNFPLPQRTLSNAAEDAENNGKVKAKCHGPLFATPVTQVEAPLPMSLGSLCHQTQTNQLDEILGHASN